MTEATQFPRIEDLKDVIEILDVSPEFVERCRRAAEQTWQVRKLRDQHRNTRFRYSGFTAYVCELAVAAAVDAKELLAWFGIRDLTDNAEAIPAFRLASGLGLSAREFLTRVRFQTAQRLNEPVWRACAGAPLNGPETLEGCDEILAQIEWDENTKALLTEFEKATLKQ